MRIGLLSIWSLGLCLTLGEHTRAHSQLEDYPESLDNIRIPHVDLATFPIRPMLIDPNDNLWVINHYDSRLLRFPPSEYASAANAGDPDRNFDLPWSPVSVAWWDGPGNGGGAEILVVCRGTWAVVGLDPDTGAFKRVIQVLEDETLRDMAEPGDIVIDETTDMAFISCSGSDTVIQIDLVTNTRMDTFGFEDGDPAFRVKSPTFLTLTADSKVLVTPLHSGNNTHPDATVSFFPDKIIKGTLPDEDLFEITPATAPDNGTVSWISKGLGTILFAHAVRPMTSELWVLNTDALNFDPTHQSEQSIAGKFAVDRISIVDLQDPGAAPEIVCLNASNVSTDPTCNPCQDPTVFPPIGQPYQLTFSADGSVAFVVSLLTNNLVAIDATTPTPSFLWEVDLGAAAIPRAVLPDPTSPAHLLVYAWGRNEVQRVRANGQVLHTLDLGHDPTPGPSSAGAPDIRRGRELFFDGQFSATESLSCATCHVEARTDFLTWNLSNRPDPTPGVGEDPINGIDVKGAMFTQILVGLERLRPFHWRGERQLEDFRGAFESLLGDDEPFSESDFADLEAYLFHLRNPANPFQHRERKLDPAIVHPTSLADSTLNGGGPGDATVGVLAYQDADAAIVESHACVECHALPTGANGDIVADQGSANNPRRGNFKTAPFHELWRKHQPTEPGGRSFLGAGLSHTGIADDLFDFVELVTPKPNGDVALMENQRNITNFVHQWDQGIAPTAHMIVHADGPSWITAEAEIQLLQQESEENCDLVVLGQARPSPGAALRATRWSFDFQTQAYRADDAAFADRTLADFESAIQAAVDPESHVFMGLPQGMGERFAVDFDMDGVVNVQDGATNPSHAYDPTETGGAADPLTLAITKVSLPWKQGYTARLLVETNEPTTLELDYYELAQAPGTNPMVTSDTLSRHHTLLIPDLRPTTPAIPGSPAIQPELVIYQLDITVRDNHGEVDSTSRTLRSGILTLALDGDPIDSHDRENNEHYIRSLGMTLTPSATNPDRWDGSVTATMSMKRGAWVPDLQGGLVPPPANGRLFAGRLLIRTPGGDVYPAEAVPGVSVTVTPGVRTGKVNHAVHFCREEQNCDLAGVANNDNATLQGIDGQNPDGGPFLFSRFPSFVGGVTAVNFSIEDESPDSVLSGGGYDLIYVVDAVVERDPAVSVPYVADADRVLFFTLYRKSLSQWSFPDSKEVNASVEEPLD